MHYASYIGALEDKILQRAVVRVLNAIYEEDFLGFSYGFRPGRSQHHALDALSVGINAMRVNWILDADIRSFFDQIDQAWLLRFLRHRVGDERIIRLVLKWLKAGVLDEGEWSVSDRGTPQGSGASPLLANVYLHYVFDLWAEQWRRQHPEKTRLLEFGRYASERRQRRGLGKPETFQFLGFVFICGRSRLGRFQLQRRTRADRMRERLRAIKDQLRKHMHASIPEQGKWLKSVMTGYFAYHAVPTNMRSLQTFRHRVMVAWRPDVA